MSNLSELLPTGGVQNSVDFVATGTLSSGQTVALRADGTVEAVTETPAGPGTAVVFNSGSTIFNSATFDSTNGKVVIAYVDGGNSSYGTAVVGTVSGATIIFGTAVVFESASTNSTTATFDSTNGKVVIAYVDSGNSGYLTAIVGTVSGTSISFGTAVVFESATTNAISATYDSTNGKVVIAYRDDGTSNYGTAIVGTVSGTSISFGTAVVFNSSASNYTTAVYDSANGKVVITYLFINGYAIVGTVSGTSISFGTAVVSDNNTGEGASATYDSTNNKVVIVYRGRNSPNYGYAIVGTVSGTSISFGTAVVFESADVNFVEATFDSTNGKVVIAYRDVGNSNYGTAVVGTVSGTAISFDTPVVFESADTTSIAPTFDSTNGKVVIAYRDGGNSSYGTGVVFAVTNSSNNTDFIGITAAAISSAASGSVNVYGGINTVQTGLTIASDYYVQADGSLTTASASPAVKVGQAISATTINLMDLT